MMRPTTHARHTRRRTPRFSFAFLLFVGACLLAPAAGAEQPPPPDAPGAPDDLLCSTQEDGTRLIEWSSVEGADYYHVYRSEDVGEDERAPAYLATTPSTSFVDNETLDADGLAYWVSSVGEGGESLPTLCQGRRGGDGVFALAVGVGVVGLGVAATFFLVARP